MDLGVTDRLRPLLDAVRTFIDERVIPVDHEYFAEVDKGDRWSLTERRQEIIEGLKSAAREQNLWNFWLTDSESGYGLSTRRHPIHCVLAARPRGRERAGGRPARALPGEQPHGNEFPAHAPHRSASAD